MTKLAQALREHRSPKGQVATYLVLWTAVLMLLAAVTMNIGQVALVRTNTANAADSAALELASELGAIARYECKQVLDDVNDCHHVCGDLWEAIGNLLLDFVISLFVPLYMFKFFANVLRATTIAQYQVNSLVEKIQRANISVRQRIREQAMLTAFSQVVDDPAQVVDDRDFDDDGDTQEMISAFANWFNNRIDRIDNPNGERRRELRDMIEELAGKRDWANTRDLDADGLPKLLDSPSEEANWGFLQYSRHFRHFLGNAFEAFLGWQRNIDPVSFWIAGGPQLPPPPSGRTTEPPSCDPDIPPGCTPAGQYAGLVIALQGYDQVDWLKTEDRSGTLGSFDAWIVDLAKKWAFHRGRIIRHAHRWQGVLQGFWEEQLSVWELMLQGWIDELRQKQSPCYPSNPPACSIPPISGFDITGYANPTEWATARLSEFKSRMETLKTDIAGLQAEMPSAWHDVYSWIDARGYWHHVKVSVVPFQVPQADYWHDFLVTCVRIKYRWTGEDGQPPAEVHVWRYDQDREVNRPWLFRVRDNPERCVPGNPASPPSDCLDPSADGTADQYGIHSFARAHYTFHLNDVWLSKAR